jgi:hypothetical protein
MKARGQAMAGGVGARPGSPAAEPDRASGDPAQVVSDAVRALLEALPPLPPLPPVEAGASGDGRREGVVESRSSPVTEPA